MTANSLVLHDLFANEAVVFIGLLVNKNFIKRISCNIIIYHLPQEVN